MRSCSFIFVPGVGHCFNAHWNRLGVCGHDLDGSFSIIQWPAFPFFPPSPFPLLYFSKPAGISSWVGREILNCFLNLRNSIQSIEKIYYFFLLEEKKYIIFVLKYNHFYFCLTEKKIIYICIFFKVMISWNEKFFFLSCLIRYMWIYDDPRRNSSAILSAIYLVNFKSRQLFIIYLWYTAFY